MGRTAGGEHVYFVLPDTMLGAMAERAAADPRRCAVLPNGVDPVTIAAAMNPAMSSWIALRRRIAFEPGQSVLVLGATGNAGQLAVQIAGTSARSTSPRPDATRPGSTHSRRSAPTAPSR